MEKNTKITLETNGQKTIIEMHGQDHTMEKFAEQLYNIAICASYHPNTVSQFIDIDGEINKD